MENEILLNNVFFFEETFFLQVSQGCNPPRLVQILRIDT